MKYRRDYFFEFRQHRLVAELHNPDSLKDHRIEARQLGELKRRVGALEGAGWELLTRR